MLSSPTWCWNARFCKKKKKVRSCLQTQEFIHKLHFKKVFPEFAKNKVRDQGVTLTRPLSQQPATTFTSWWYRGV